MYTAARNLRGGGISKEYPTPRSIYHRVRPDHRDHRPGHRVRGTRRGRIHPQPVQPGRQHGEQRDDRRHRCRRGVRRRCRRADSATVQAAIAEDAKDWTLDEQKAVAEDIAAKGEASPAYAKARAAMDAGTKFSMKLTDGQTLEYKIIGIDQDDLADGSGKAGLTFLTTSTGIMSRVNATDTNAGGWEKSELRAKMNSGEIWNLMPSDFQSKVKAVRKLTNNVDGKTKDAAVTATTDKLFLLSYSEIVDAPYSRWAQTYPWSSSEGTQYEAFKGKDSPKENGVTEISGLANGNMFYERGTYPSTTEGFLFVTKYGSTGTGGYYVARMDMSICPVFCF